MLLKKIMQTNMFIKLRDMIHNHMIITPCPHLILASFSSQLRLLTGRFFYFYYYE